MPNATATPLVLRAKTAADLMEGNPAAVRDVATVPEAVAFLTDRGVSAAAVVNEAGLPVGVLSRADILVHDRERAAHPAAAGRDDATLVRDLMTPAVFSVTPTTPVARVVEEMVAMNVHQLFVVDREGYLVGVVSAFDIVRHLRP
jgi:CBS domain-containing protein